MPDTNILIVENEYLIGLEMKNMLQNMGYTVLELVGTGEKAIGIVNESKVDIILMDVVLQGKIDGIQTAEIIRNKYDIPVIFVTAYSDEEIISRIKKIEPYGYLTKPFRERELTVIIDIVLYRHNTEKDLKNKQQELIHLNKNLEKIVEERTKELKQEIEMHKRMEEELRKSEERFRELADLLPLSILEIDSGNNITYFNKALVEMLGYSEMELKKNQLQFPSIIEGEKKQIKFLEKVKKGKRIDLAPFSLIKSDGARLEVLISLAPFYKDNIMNGIRGAIIDIKRLVREFNFPDDSFYEKYFLSKREKEVFNYLMKGFKDFEIAERTFISRTTVRYHITNIYNKLGVNNRSELFDVIKEHQFSNSGYDSFLLYMIKALSIE